jgi:WD40 repeat protein
MSGTSGSAPALAPSEIDTREEFAAALTALRTYAGFSIRGLAQALGTPTATIGDYCSGRHLPGPAQQDLFFAMLRTLGVEEQQLNAWVEVVARLRVGSDGRMRRVAVPYQGLSAFGAEDHERFFGREAVTEEVLARLRDQVSGAAPRGIVLVVGPSGVGKSSLLHAGVQSRIEQAGLGGTADGWSVCLLSPGDRPVEALHASLADGGGRGCVLIVDQLEELFALPAQVQDRFLDELTRLAQQGTLVLAGLRADFYEHAARLPALLAALRATPVLLGPMSDVELRSAITGPARYAGAQVDDGLVERVIADLAPRDASGFAHDAGSLPLLSHALLQIWERARGNHLTITDYRASGGLQGAVRQTAEEVFTNLDDDQQVLARRLFMRLVRVPEDGPAVRRRARRQELEALRLPEDQQAVGSHTSVGSVVDRFVGARLMTADTATVELSHEALLTAWPRLASWIEENRDGIRLHRQLTDAANDWLASERDPALLLRGARLQLSSEWANEPENRDELNADERALLGQSQELAQSTRRAARRRATQTRLLIAASSLLAVAALVLAAVALHASDVAKRARDNALSRQVALQAASVAPADPSLAMQLAVLAHRIAPTTGATSALLNASDSELPTRLLGPTGPAFLSIAAHANWMAVAYSAVSRIGIYELTGAVPQLRATIRAGGPSAQLFAVALSPNGRLLAAGGTNHQVSLWSLSSEAHASRIATLTLPAGTVYGLAFSADGKRLAAVDATRVVDLWSIGRSGKPKPLTVLTVPGQTQLHAVAFAPDGAGLAAAGTNGAVALWRGAARGTTPATMTVAGAPTFNVVSFSPNATSLAVGGTDDVIHRWALTSAGAPKPLGSLHGFTSWVESLSFSPDGKELAAGSSDSSLRVWSTATSALLTAIEHPAAVTGAAFSSNGSRLISVDSSGTLRAWTMPAPAMRTARGKIFGLDYTANGKELAVISSGPQGNAELWDASDPNNPTLIANVATGSFGPVAGAGALTASGNLLAIANAKAQVRLIAVGNPRDPQPVGPVLDGASPYIEQMAFAPSGRLLATGDDAGHINLWNTSKPSRPLHEPTLNMGAAPQIMLGVAFSPNGRLLASASTSGHVTLWNVADPAHPSLLATVGRLSGYAYTVAFTPNGRTLIAAGADRTVELWNISDPSHPRSLGNPLTGPTSTIYDVAVSPDGKQLAAATTDGSVWLWNVSQPSAPRQEADLSGSTSELYSVSFQPRSHTLVAGGTDQELHLWNDDPADLAKQICRLAGTALTAGEWSEYVQSGRYEPPCR